MTDKSIGEVAREAKVEASTLRYYESIGLLLPAERVNGQRRYDEESMKRLTVIQIAKEAGFTLKEIDTLLSGFSDDTPPSERWKTLASNKLLEIDALIAKAQGMKMVLEEGMNCDCLSLDVCAHFIRE